MLPRGLRNNNPGNLRLTSTLWAGEVKGADPDFKVFETPADGIRGINLSLLKKTARSLNTINQIIGSYAPPTENKTNLYTQSVIKDLGISGDVSLNLNNLDLRIRLINSIIKYENGYTPFSPDQIKQAITGDK